MSNMKNMVIAFSDGSRQFSTPVVYLVSYNDNGPEYTVNMVSSLSRLGRMSKKRGKRVICIPCQNMSAMGYFWQPAESVILQTYFRNSNCP